MNLNRVIGRNIRYARKEAGLSTKELADSLCVSEKTIEAYESGRIRISAESLYTINQAIRSCGIELSVNDYYGGIIMEDENILIKRMSCMLKQKGGGDVGFHDLLYAFFNKDEPGQIISELIGSITEKETTDQTTGENLVYAEYILNDSKETTKLLNDFKEKGCTLPLFPDWSCEFYVRDIEYEQIKDFVKACNNEIIGVCADPEPDSGESFFAYVKHPQNKILEDELEKSIYKILMPGAGYTIDISSVESVKNLALAGSLEDLAILMNKNRI